MSCGCKSKTKQTYTKCGNPIAPNPVIKYIYDDCTDSPVDHEDDSGIVVHFAYGRGYLFYPRAYAGLYTVMPGNDFISFSRIYRADQYGHQYSVFCYAFDHLLHLLFGVFAERMILKGDEAVYVELGKLRLIGAAVGGLE